MDEIELERVIERVVKSSIEHELGAYKVDKEQHYQDHNFLRDFREWYGSLKSSFWKSLVGAFVMMFLALLLFGFIFWGKVSLR